MKSIATIFLCLIANLCIAQNIGLSGPIFNADTVRITVIYESQIVYEKIETSPIYQIKLGHQSEYIIKFEADGRVKKLSFFCENVNTPTVIEQQIDFDNQTHLILCTWQRYPKGNRRAKNRIFIDRTYYGPHASWKDEF